MRSTWLTRLTLTAATAVTFSLAPTAPLAQAQIPGQAPAATPVPPQNTATPAARLDALLKRWEVEMQAVQTAAAQCSRTNLDKTFGSMTTFDGVLKFMKPDLVMVEMHRRNKPEVFEKYVFTGTYLYEYAQDRKEIRVHDLTDGKPAGQQVDNQMSLMMGMKAEAAKERYDLRLGREDQWYYYVDILPKRPTDKQDFKRARLVLTKDRFLPRQIWFEEANGNEVTWEVPRVEVGSVLNRTEFAQPTLPAGWKFAPQPRQNAPRAEAPARIIRPAGQ